MARSAYPALVVAASSAVAAGLFALAFYPGWLSFDSSYQWWQARSGEISTINGIGIVLLWRAALLLQDGPGPLLLAQLAVFWTGATWIALGAPAATRARVLLVGALALAPASWLLGQLWSDSALLALLTLATGAILRYRAGAGNAYLAAAAVALALAASLRHNAIFAIAPLLLWFCGVDAATTRRARLRRAAAAIAFAALTLAGTQVIAQRATRHWYPVLPSLTLWDLSGMSVHENRVLLPDYAVAPQTGVADLASAYVPWSNTPLFASPRAGVRYPFQPWPDADQRRLREDWLATILQHPRAYAAHRAALLADLFGTRARDRPAELTYVPGPVPYRDNPIVDMRDGPMRRYALRAFDVLRATLAFAAWPYLLIGVLAAAAISRRRHPLRAPVLWLCASAWAYALPYLVLAPAAEFRYLLWSCVASVIAGWLSLAAFLRPAPDTGGGTRQAAAIDADGSTQTAGAEARSAGSAMQ